jgi:hypothetical protein
LLDRLRAFAGDHPRVLDLIAALRAGVPRDEAAGSVTTQAGLPPTRAGEAPGMTDEPPEQLDDESDDDEDAEHDDLLDQPPLPGPQADGDG